MYTFNTTLALILFLVLISFLSIVEFQFSHFRFHDFALFLPNLSTGRFLEKNKQDKFFLFINDLCLIEWSNLQ